jgi:hypothetical protein
MAEVRLSTCKAQLAEKLPEVIQSNKMTVSFSPLMPILKNITKARIADSESRAELKIWANFLETKLHKVPETRAPRSGKRRINFISIVGIYRSWVLPERETYQKTAV